MIAQASDIICLKSYDSNDKKVSFVLRITL